MQINVGEQYFYKTSKSRGRPFVGKVVKRQGLFVKLENREGDVVSVQQKFIVRPYERLVYNTKAKRQAATA